MKRLFKVGAVLAAGAVTLSSFASIALADSYGTAGCGLGSIIFHDKPGMIQVLAATTNTLFGSQTFGISSGTSNCGSSEVSEAVALEFIQTNREAFAKDAARGNGETISSLATLAGCSNVKAVGAVLQSEFKTIFPSAKATDLQVSANAIATLRAHGELSCQELI